LLEGIRTILRQEQFIPFRFVMSSGKDHEVRLPEMAWVLRNDILVGTDITDNGMPAEFDICPLLHTGPSSSPSGCRILRRPFAGFTPSGAMASSRRQETDCDPVKPEP
jgi:hypothetical protein